jgi:2-polyprenyl-3-methyl-5-hydroxy-6-metoxy-1,4-benzoquinol methylase
MMSHLYNAKESVYYTNSRSDLLSRIPKNPDQKILELGAGGGDTILAIKELGMAKEVVGIELFKLSGTNQGHAAIDRMIFADIEKDKIDLSNDYFDVIICGDVLEHLVDPWATMSRLNHWLKPNGTFILSIPNIREFKALYTIYATGNFKYDPSGGILDKTHLRFFCKKNMKEMMQGVNTNIESITPSFQFIGIFERGLNQRRIINAITFGFLEEFLALQYVITAKKRIEH